MQFDTFSDMSTKALKSTQKVKARNVKVPLTGVSAKVTVGSVTVSVSKPTQEMIKRNIAASGVALSRAMKEIIKPGVKLNPAKGVPLYQADPDNPDLIIRKLDGKLEKGRFVAGKFKAA